MLVCFSVLILNVEAITSDCLLRSGALASPNELTQNGQIMLRSAQKVVDNPVDNPVDKLWTSCG
jgi:hypothetical protein